MNTLQAQLVKHRHLITNLRSTIKQPEKKMTTTETQVPSRSTGGNAANKRYKRSTEELLADIEKVDQLVASGRFNQIEALNHIGLQSSVYHYKKKQLQEQVAKSLKPRKFAERPNRTPQEQSYSTKREQVLKQLEQKPAPSVETKAAPVANNDEISKLKAELAAYKEKYAKLSQYIVEKEIL